MDYTSSVAPSTCNIVNARDVLNCSTSAGSNSIQEEYCLWVLPLETVPDTVKHEKTCSFCQKPEFLHLVNNLAIAQLPGIKLI